MSFTAEQLHHLRHGWLKKIQSSTGEYVKDVLATVIMSTTPRQAYIIQHIQRAFLKPSPGIGSRAPGGQFLTGTASGQGRQPSGDPSGNEPEDLDASLNNDEQARSRYESDSSSADQEGSEESSDDEPPSTAPQVSANQQSSREADEAKTAKINELQARQRELMKALAASVSKKTARAEDFPVKDKDGRTPSDKKKSRKSKKKSKKKRKTAANHESDAKEDQNKVSAEQVVQQPKRKADAQDPQTPEPPKKRHKGSKRMAQLSPRPSVQGSTPETPETPAQPDCRGKHHRHARRKPHAAVPIKEESDDDVQMLDEPTTPFKEFKPVVASRAEAERENKDANHSDETQDIINSPTLAVPDNRVAILEREHHRRRASEESYADPSGETEYQCKHCSLWFRVSENSVGACRRRVHTGTRGSIRYGRYRWSCCGRVTFSHSPAQKNGCQKRAHAWNGMEDGVKRRKQPKHDRFDVKL